MHCSICITKIINLLLKGEDLYSVVCNFSLKKCVYRGMQSCQTRWVSSNHFKMLELEWTRSRKGPVLQKKMPVGNTERIWQVLSNKLIKFIIWHLMWLRVECKNQGFLCYNYVQFNWSYSIKHNVWMTNIKNTVSLTNLEHMYKNKRLYRIFYFWKLITLIFKLDIYKIFAI